MRSLFNTGIAVFACVAAASAQDMAAIDAADVRQYAELLSLDEERQATAMDHYRVYRSEMREVAADLRELHMDSASASLEDVREGRLASAYFNAIMRAGSGADDAYELYTKPQRIERELLDAVLALASTPEQRDGAERVERAWRRDRASAVQSPFGETADVVEMARRLRYHELEPVAEILLAYELEIDPIRSAQLIELPPEPPAEQDREPAERTESLGLQAKRINIEFARRIKRALPPEDRERWDRAVREAFWPGPYQRSGPQMVVGALRLNRTLTDDDRERLEAISTRYEERAGPINRQWAAALDAQLHATASQDWEGAADANQTIYDSRESRRVLDEEFEKLLAEFGREVASRQ